MPARPIEKATLRIAADVGGTFTDLAVFDEASGHIRLGKTAEARKNGFLGDLPKDRANLGTPFSSHRLA